MHRRNTTSANDCTKELEPRGLVVSFQNVGPYKVPLTRKRTEMTMPIK